VNHLISDIAPKWEISKIEAAFKAVQEERNERVQWLVDDAHKNQQMQAMATPLLAFVGPLLGLLDTSTALRISGNKNLAAGRVNSIPLPRREHSIPFNDELPARPLSLTWLPVGLGALTQGVLFRLSNKILLPLQIPTTFGGAPLLDHYTGVGIADKILSALVAVFSIPLASDHREANMQWIAFTPLLLSTTLDWTVESYRNGLKGLLTSL
jgi:hypothetical protein